jgi:formamidopyrimidine-DNA glycosylase
VPELPEVEVACRSLQHTVVGKTITRVSVRQPMAIRSHSAARFARALRGAVVTGVERRGKTLRFGLDGRVLVFHFMLWGIVRYRPAGEAGPAARVVLHFSDGSSLEFRDLQLSQFHLLGPDASAFDGGIDPLSPATTFQTFRRALRRRGSIRSALTDGARIAGIGNLWSQEVLFAARLKPARQAGSLREPELRALYRAMRQVLRRAVGAGGEPGFEDARGRRGRFRLMVYGRTGEPCRVCGRAIRGGRLGGRPAFFCPACQR